MTMESAELPQFMYGTAWKEERTAELTAEALRAGFRAIDTANQRRHYVEAGVGEAWVASGLSRGDIFLQTKFTYRRGQDHRLPYDPEASLTEQVGQSFASSLEHLQTDYVDSYVLHGPSSPHRLTAHDHEVWRAMEGLSTAGHARALGVSNVHLEQLEDLVRFAEQPPTFVQNRCFARTGWDAEVRKFCATKGIRYQGFSLLTANRRELDHPDVRKIADRYQSTVPQVTFRFALQLGMLPLTGTTQRVHMDEDLLAVDLQLTDEEMQTMLTVG